MSGQSYRPLTINEIRQALTRPLPGVAGQKKMAPEPSDKRVDRWQKPGHCRDAGVLLLLYPRAINNRIASPVTELHIALILRTEYPGTHSGQISFPGGQREGQESLQTTALREAMEEVGVLPGTVEVIGQLSPIYIPTSNFCIYPFVAFSPVRPDFQLDPKEVAALIETPLNLLRNPANQKEEIRHFKGTGDRHIPFFDVFGHHVWGATAMMLGEFLMVLQQIER